MKKKALVLIGFQRDYFDKNGILHNVVEESLQTFNVLENTVNVVEYLKGSEDYLIISTPIVFSKDYFELKDPIGILSTIKDVGAFKSGEPGCETIDSIASFGDSILTIPGKQGLNAFVNTELEDILRKNNIEDVVLAGCVCSICIDSTGRSAAEKGFNVTMLSDCISSRTTFEHEFYMENVFPLYAEVKTTSTFLEALKLVSVD
jgi:nicotinamidase-related amidase